MMHNNFTFVVNDTTTFLRWNPTRINLGVKERTIFTPLDGPPVIHYLDTTEILGQLIWENAPVQAEFQYAQLEGLVGQSGVIYTNQMPQLLGTKNLLNQSHLGDVLSGTDYWTLGCGGTYHTDGSIYAPDGVSLVTLYKTDYASTGAGCYVSPASFATFAADNVLSCYVKYGSNDRIGINMYQQAETESHTGAFLFSGSGSRCTPVLSSSVNDLGVEKVPGHPGWFKIWIYVDGCNAVNGDIQGSDMRIFIYNGYAWGATDIIGSYVTNIQVEHGVTKPTWFAETIGAPINEPFNVQFLDMQTDYLDHPGVVKHRVILNFKMIGDNL